MSSESLYQHYFEYLLSPPVLLTLWILLIPVLLERYKDKIIPPAPQPFNPPGCFQLGLRNRSNLSDQYEEQSRSKTIRGIRGDSLRGSAQVQALFTYPLKSCRGVELLASEVGATGLKYDRVFIFARSIPQQAGEDGDQHEWRFMTQREYPKLALLKIDLWVPDPRASMRRAASNSHTPEPRAKRGRKRTRDALPKDQKDPDAPQQRLREDWAANGGCVVVHFPHQPRFNPFGMRTETVELRIPLSPTPQRAQSKLYRTENVRIWKDCPRAVDMTSEIEPQALSKLKAFLGVKDSLALFRVSDRDKRAVTRSLPNDRPEEAYSITFADAFPIHILNLASIRAVDSALPTNASMKDALDACRFRANIYVTGPPPFGEDNWKRITLGRCLVPRPEATQKRSPLRDPRNTLMETDGLYHVACRTARCTLPNVDQQTGVKDRNEPYTALKKTRVVDEGAKPHSVLGLHAIPLFAQGILRVGDDVHVLEEGEHVYEKMFPD